MIDETAMIPCQCISQREFAIGNKARTFREGLGIRPFILPHPPPPRFARQEPMLSNVFVSRVTVIP